MGDSQRQTKALHNYLTRDDRGSARPSELGSTSRSAVKQALDVNETLRQQIASMRDQVSARLCFGGLDCPTDCLYKFASERTTR